MIESGQQPNGRETRGFRIPGNLTELKQMVVAAFTGKHTETAAKAMSTRDEAERDGAEHSFTKESSRQLAKTLNIPLRVFSDGEVFWFDAQGAEATDAMNIEKFEAMYGLSEYDFRNLPDVGGISALELAQKVAQAIIAQTQDAVKFNRVWFVKNNAPLEESNDGGDEFKKMEEDQLAKYGKT